MEFKNLTQGIYNIFENNNIGLIVSIMKIDHYKFYKRFGGFSIEEEVETYGNLDSEFVRTSWDPSLVAPFFKKAFLS